MSILRERRLLHTVLLVIILATLPCYCAGAMLLGLAPDRSQERLAPTRPLTITAPALTVIGSTATASLFPTITPLPPIWATPTPIIGGTLATPGQWAPPRPTSTPWPTVTPWPTWTPSSTWWLPPTATISIPTSTLAPTVTFTFTWTPPPTSTPTVELPSNTPVLAPTNTEPPPPTPTPEVLDSFDITEESPG